MTTLALMLFSFSIITKAEAFIIQNYTVEVSVDGIDRKYDIYHPRFMGDKEKVLLIALHGGGGNPSAFKDKTGLDKAAKENGWIVVFPKGKGRNWNVGDGLGSSENDLKFINTIIEQVEPDKTIVIGHSRGAMMALNIMCNRNDIISVVSVSGTLNTDCESSVGTSVMFIHGGEDENVPWEGNEKFNPVEYGIITVLDHNQCDYSSTIIIINTDELLDKTIECNYEVMLELVYLRKWGHEWPGSEVITYNATDQSLIFFKNMIKE